MKHPFIFTLWSIIAVMLLTNCKNEPTLNRFGGKISGATNRQLLLELLNFNRTTKAIGRVTTDANGNFKIEQKQPFEQGVYRLNAGDKNLFFMLDGKEKQVEITADINTLDKMEVTVKGSSTFECYAKIVRGLIADQASLNKEIIDTRIKQSCNPLMASFFTLQLLAQNPLANIADFKRVNTELGAYMPGSQYANDFNSMIVSIENSVMQEQAAAVIKQGQPAPDINLPNPDGKNIALSSLKGKVVLLDFWASWCRPCRMANPHVVQIYKKYKDKGFTVYSVSLDKEDGKQAWVSAIKQDGLEWESHVSDLKFWNAAPAALYGVRSIPQTFLIDKAGNIAAINPRTNLEEEVVRVLGN